MPLATTRRSGLVDQVIGQLREAVVRGEWPVGERIPPESELVASLGVGRNTVREAVRALSHSGLLEVRQGDGTYVRATSEVSGAIRRLCGTELREVLQVRRTLEVEGARLAATARTEDELRELATLLDRRDAAQGDRRIEGFVRVDAEFHLAVVRAGHNTLLTELYRGLTEVVRGSVAATTDMEWHLAPPRSPDARGAERGRSNAASVATTSQTEGEREHIEHRGLLNAIADRDPERAAREAAGFLDDLLAREQSRE